MKYSNYNELMKMKHEIINKLNRMNIDEIIVEDLSNIGFDIENTNIEYLKNIIKKFVLEYNLYSREGAIKLFLNNSDHLFGYSREEIINNKKVINSLLKSTKSLRLILNSEIFDDFLIKCADRVNNSINGVNILQHKIQGQ